jgi:FAD:protein FMN transferase
VHSTARAAESANGPRRVLRVEEHWGTVITVDVRDDIEKQAVDECFTWFRRVDALFSTWRPDSEIMRIGRCELLVRDASAEVREVLALSEEMRCASHGAFDISFGARAKVAPRPGLAPLDPSGVVKGWAVARAGEILQAAGASCYFVNAGGDVVARGCPEGSVSGWRIGIQHPWERDRVAAVLVVEEGAVATSGRYERGDHVLDPTSGLPVSGLASVTVVGSDLAIADAYATAAMVLGAEAGMRWLMTREGYEGLAITDSRTVLMTPGIARYRVA